jgi:alkylation response protein AidB-like acyl-CoA dehydrogenase
MIGAVGGGWKIAMGLLAFERGVSTLGQQMGFRNELDEIIAAAKANGTAKDPLIRQRIAKAEIGLRLMRYGALRMLSNTDHSKIDGAALTYKIQWATWRRNLGELAMDVLGQMGEVTDNPEYEWDMLPNLFLYLALRHDLRRHQPDPAQPDRGTRRLACRANRGATYEPTPTYPNPAAC